MYGWRGRLGVIMPDNNVTVEPELYSVLPAGVSLHGSRVGARGAGELRDQVLTMADALPRAVESFRGRVDVIGYACMATSLWKPAGWHEPLGAAAGVAFLAAGETMVAALVHLGARRIGVFSPYPDDLARLVAGWFERHGIVVVHTVNLPLDTLRGTPSLEDLYPTVRREFAGRSIAALAVLSTDLATFTVIEPLEGDLGIPVISSNLALLWSLLASAGIREPACPGRLFRADAEAAAARPISAPR
jgi:maleate isomerase